MSIEPKPADEAPIGELMSRLTAQTTRLVRDEMRLAQKEFVESAKHAGLGAGLLSVAGVVAVFGAASLLAAIIAALALVLPVWAAALIVAVVLFAVAGIAALISKKQLDQASPTPEKTVANVKQDVKEVSQGIEDARHEH